MTSVVSPVPTSSATAEFTVTVTVNADPSRNDDAAAQFADRLRAAFEQVSLPSPTYPAHDGEESKAALETSLLTVDVPSRKVWLYGVELELTRLEFDLLLYLCRHSGRVVTRSILLSEVWHTAGTTGARTIDVHIRRLRCKLADDSQLITTVRKVGYRLEGTAIVSITE